MYFDIIIGHHNKDIYRERNLKYVLGYYSKRCPDSNIIVVEQNSETDLKEFSSVNHVKINHGKLYNRGLGFNTGMKQVKNEMCLLVDNDCILDPKFLDNLGYYIKKSEFFIPYNIVIDLNEKETQYLISTNKIIGGASRGGNNLCVGGSLFISKKAYNHIGGYEEFYGWGGEDECLYHKGKELIGISRIAGRFPMFHMYHPSAVNNSWINSRQYKDNVSILRKIEGMNKGELLNYLKDKNSVI
jgi:hypothetical protein